MMPKVAVVINPHAPIVSTFMSGSSRKAVGGLC